jgi:membrane protein implicated in regulation of membrane protease activity
LHALLSLSKLALLLEAALTIAAAGNSQIFAAVIAGVFMLVNSVLTIWLTVRFARRRDEPPSREPPDPP